MLLRATEETLTLRNSCAWVIWRLKDSATLSSSIRANEAGVPGVTYDTGRIEKSTDQFLSS